MGGGFRSGGGGRGLGRGGWMGGQGGCERRIKVFFWGGDQVKGGRVGGVGGLGWT